MTNTEPYNRTLALNRAATAARSTVLPAALFIAGNIALPQLAHLVPGGGPTWLPIYLFTLVGAWCYGWRVGLLTAVLSPLANSLIFGMPATAVLPAILLKSTLLAGFASLAASKVRGVKIGALAAVVIAYQGLGTLGEWALSGSFFTACQDFRIGLPGMLLQIVGGWLAIHSLRR